MRATSKWNKCGGYTFPVRQISQTSLRQVVESPTVTQPWKCLLRCSLVQNHGIKKRGVKKEIEMKRFWICWIKKGVKAFWVDLFFFHYFFSSPHTLCISLIPSGINRDLGLNYISVNIYINGQLSASYVAGIWSTNIAY